MSELLMRLMDASGISGNEQEVRSIILKEMKKYVSSCKVDKFGNLICHKSGSKPTILLTAHMDEIGLMIKKIDEDGRIYMSDIGGMETLPLAGQRVMVPTKKGIIYGVITTHNITDSYPEDTVPNIRGLFIDTGLDKKQLLESGVEIGSYLTFERKALYFGNEKIISGKALDDRIGCYVLIELAKRLQKASCEIYYIFTVQEEIGLYGATTSIYNIDPDWAINVDATNANDALELPTKIIGKGPCITIKDSEMISNKCISDWLKDIARKNKIPAQLEVSNFGTTDALNISVSKGGIPSAVVSIPVRNLHTTFGIAHMDDIDNAVKLIESLLLNPPKTIIL